MASARPYSRSLHSLHELPDAAPPDVERPSLAIKPSEVSEVLKTAPAAVTLDYTQPATFRRRTMSRYHQWRTEKPMLVAGATGAALMIFSFIGLVLLLKVLLPPIDPADAPTVKIPKSFDDLKALNEVIQIYKKRHLFRVLFSFCSVYLMLQAFSLPGSMYMSIIGGAIFGYVNIALCCSLVATGATLCYAISALLGPALLSASDTWQRRVDGWTVRVQEQGQNLFSYLVILRISPLPPHWVLNVVAPHLGIKIPLFWTSTWVGMLGVTFIHTQIGLTLDEMTSPADFHLISWRNAIGLGGIICAVSVPIVLRRIYRHEIADAAAVDDAQAIALPIDSEEALLPPRSTGLRDATLVFLREDGRVDERRVRVGRAT